MPDTIAVKDANGDTVTVKTNDELSTKLSTLGTQTTLAAILAKILTAPATEAKQDTLIGHVDGIETLLGTLGTQTTLAAILAKLIAAPATEAKQDTLIGHVDGIETLLGTLGTQATLAAILAKIIAAPATEAKQDTLIGYVDGIEALLAGATPAGTNLIGAVAARLGTSTMYDGTTAVTPKFAAIAASSSGNNTLLAAVASKKIRVLSVHLMAAGAVNAKFQSGAGGTDLTGLNYFDAAGAGIVLPFNPVGWFETAVNTLLNLNLSGAVAVGGSFSYVEVA